MADKTEWVVNGVQFGTQQDAELAQNEKIRIERLEEKLDYQNQEMVYAVYKKAVNNRVFRTPVGYDFLKRLQRILYDNAQEDIANIPIYGVYSMRESANPTIERIQASRKRKTKAGIFQQENINNSEYRTAGFGDCHVCDSNHRFESDNRKLRKDASKPLR